MINRIRDFFEELQIDWEEFWWKYSLERKELAHLRITAHQLAMKEGHNSPYTHPDDYADGFVPKSKLR